MHPYHIKEIENKPGLKNFNLNLILICNIYMQSILLGNCARIRFFTRTSCWRKSKEWHFWYKNNGCVNTDQSTFYVALLTIYIPDFHHSVSILCYYICYQCARSVNCAATQGEMWHGRQQRRRGNTEIIQLILTFCSHSRISGGKRLKFSEIAGLDKFANESS